MIFWSLNSLKKRGVVVHKNRLASCQLVSSQRRAAHSDVSIQTEQPECLVTVKLTPHTYTNLTKTLGFFKVVLHRHGHAESNYVNRSAFLTE